MQNAKTKRLAKKIVKNKYFHRKGKGMPFGVPFFCAEFFIFQKKKY
jgi:hypothetical protein